MVVCTEGKPGSVILQLVCTLPMADTLRRIHKRNVIFYFFSKRSAVKLMPKCREIVKKQNICNSMLDRWGYTLVWVIRFCCPLSNNFAPVIKN